MVKIFHKLVSIEEAKKILTDSFQKLISAEVVDITDSVGLISSEDVYSTLDNPPFDRSEVDGYALDHRSILNADDYNPIKLKIVGTIEAGSKYLGKIQDLNECIYVATGAPIPRGSDSVVMVEYTKREGEFVYVYRPTAPGENIAHAGSDFTVEEIILRKGEKISAEKIAVLSASGIGKVSVLSKLRIGILSTGNEIIRPENEIEFGQIYDVNGPYVKTLLDSYKLIQSDYLGIIRDSYESIRDSLESYLKKYKIIITSGATSAGFHDLLYSVLDDIGATPIYHGIAIKPGKPSFLYSINGNLVIGLPGFPLSAASVLYTVIIPSILSAYNVEIGKPQSVRLGLKITPERGKELILPGILSRNGYVYPIFGESGSISRISQADGFLIVSGDRIFYNKGDQVNFYKMAEHEKDLIAIGSNDPVLERIILLTTNKAIIVNAGSMGAIEAMMNGYSDLGGLHLYKDGQYNTFVMDDKLKMKASIIRGFDRIQGFISRDGYKSFREIMERKAIFVNRNRGSGTRAIIDELIESEFGKNFDKSAIYNYFWEAKSHAAVARSVLQGRADVGISIKFYADLFNLKFHEVKKESYDIIVSRDFLDSTVGKKFIDNLKSLKQTNPPSGYIFPENIGEIIS